MLWNVSQLAWRRSSIRRNLLLSNGRFRKPNCLHCAQPSMIFPGCRPGRETQRPGRQNYRLLVLFTKGNDHDRILEAVNVNPPTVRIETGYIGRLLFVARNDLLNCQSFQFHLRTTAHGIGKGASGLDLAADIICYCHLFSLYLRRQAGRGISANFGPFFQAIPSSQDGIERTGQQIPREQPLSWKAFDRPGLPEAAKGISQLHPVVALGGCS